MADFSRVIWKSLSGSKMQHIWDPEKRAALCGTGLRNGSNRYRSSAWGPPGGGAKCKPCRAKFAARNRGTAVSRRNRAYRGPVRTEALYLLLSRQEMALLNTVAKRLGVRRTDLARAAIDAFCKKALSDPPPPRK